MANYHGIKSYIKYLISFYIGRDLFHMTVQLIKSCPDITEAFVDAVRKLIILLSGTLLTTVRLQDPKSSQQYNILY